MDEAKKRRLDYRRNWSSATRSLARMKNDDHSSPQSDSDSGDNGNEETINLHHGVVFQNEPDTDYENQDQHDSDSDLEIWGLINQQNNTILSSDSEDENEDKPLQSDLVSWATTCQIKHNHVDKLLKILQRRGHPTLPATARTLLKTAREVQLDEKSGMQYIYLDLKNEILKRFKNYPSDVRDSVNNLTLSFNIDGLPLFKSSNCSLWPILCGLHIGLEPITVFPVALACGGSKPKDLEFTIDTIRDLKEILQHGLQYNDRILQIYLKCIICDAPARAMVKCMKQYSGYYGCDRCNQKGFWLQKVTYQEVDNLVLRTDVSFRSQLQEEHHHGVSPFCELPIDMIKAFPGDYMHQSCLGVMKRLLLVWMRGPKETKMSAVQVAEISQKLINLRDSITASFARKPRQLEQVDRWKATEFRQFMLYTGKVVLKGVLRPELYSHFVCFSVALSILVCPELAHHHREYANKLLKYFVEKARVLYGPRFLVYNVHSLLHITSDVEEHGSLDGCSAFPFENYLQQLKKMVRSGRNPLAQLVKRLGELEHLQQIFNIKKSLITEKKPNNRYIIDNSKCCEVVSVLDVVDEETHEKQFLCRVYNRCQPLFMDPCDSRLIGVYSCQTRNATMKIISQRQLQKSAIMIEKDQDSTAVFMAVLHEF